MPRCDFCFRDKGSVSPIVPSIDAAVCKACSYEIDRVIGWLLYHSVSLVKQSELGSTPLIKPPTPKKPKALKSKSETSKAENHTSTIS